MNVWVGGWAVCSWWGGVGWGGVGGCHGPPLPLWPPPLLLGCPPGCLPPHHPHPPTPPPLAPHPPPPHPAAFEFSARHGLEWWQLDVTWLMIRALQTVGLATNVKLPSEKQKQRLAFPPQPRAA